eukprot:m.330648 g.330648  ORF g.330648 m.330648 type:complete len:229 (+) comp19765_c3_seq3:495-1181(+)
MGGDGDIDAAARDGAAASRATGGHATQQVDTAATSDAPASSTAAPVPATVEPVAGTVGTAPLTADPETSTDGSAARVSLCASATPNTDTAALVSSSAFAPIGTETASAPGQPIVGAKPAQAMGPLPTTTSTATMAPPTGATTVGTGSITVASGSGSAAATAATASSSRQLLEQRGVGCWHRALRRWAQARGVGRGLLPPLRGHGFMRGVGARPWQPLPSSQLVRHHTA